METIVFPVWTTETAKTVKLLHCMKIQTIKQELSPKVSFKILFQSGKIWWRNNFKFFFVFLVNDNALFSKIGCNNILMYNAIWLFLCASEKLPTYLVSTYYPHYVPCVYVHIFYVLYEYFFQPFFQIYFFVLCQMSIFYMYRIRGFRTFRTAHYLSF